MTPPWIGAVRRLGAGRQGSAIAQPCRVGHSLMRAIATLSSGVYCGPCKLRTGADQLSGGGRQAVARADQREHGRIGFALIDGQLHAVAAAARASDRELARRVGADDRTGQTGRSGGSKVSIFRRNQEQAFGAVGVQAKADSSLGAVAHCLEQLEGRRLYSRRRGRRRKPALALGEGQRAEAPAADALSKRPAVSSRRSGPTNSFGPMGTASRARS